MTITFKSPAIEVAAATMAELVEFVNAHSGKPPIKKFESHAKGVERVNAMIAAKGETTSAPPGKSANASIAKAEAANRRARKEAVAEKPKAPKSAAEQMARVLTSTAHPSTAKATPAKKVAAKAAATPKEKASGGGRAHFTEDAVITIVHKGENPKRGTAADRYDLYRNGMTVAAYIAAGGQRRDVVWDQKMGWIKTAEPK